VPCRSQEKEHADLGIRGEGDRGVVGKPVRCACGDAFARFWSFGSAECAEVVGEAADFVFESE